MFKKTITYSLGLGIITSGIFILQYINDVHLKPPASYGVASLIFIIVFIFLGIKNNATENFQIKDGLNMQAIHLAKFLDNNIIQN